MNYMLLVYSPEQAWTREEWTQCTVDSTKVCEELASQGRFIAASPLHPVATGITVRVREGERHTTKGPFAETTEQLGGYFLINVDNLDEAIAVAAKLPSAKKGTVEIRPLFPLEGLPPYQFERKGRRFMFLCYDDEAAWAKAGPEAHRSAMEEALQLVRKLHANGQYCAAAPLQPVSMATSVRIRDGKRTVTDGPFAETREILGGFYVVSLEDLDQAVIIAAEHSGARVGSVEVRELVELPNPTPPH